MTEAANTETTPATETKLVKVDVYGSEIELPEDKAKDLINKRDERTKKYKELETKLTDYEKAAAKERERAELLEKAKAGAIEEVKAIASRDAEAKLGRIHNKLISNELKASLLSHAEFIGGEVATADALKLLLADHKFEMNDKDEVVSLTGKPIADIVNEFVSSRDNLRKAKTAASVGTHTQPKTVAPKADVRASMVSGIENLLKR